MSAETPTRHDVDHLRRTESLLAVAETNLRDFESASDSNAPRPRDAASSGAGETRKTESALWRTPFAQAVSIETTRPTYVRTPIVGDRPHVAVCDSPGSRVTRASPLRNAFGGHVIGSIASARRSTEEMSPVNTMTYG